MDGEGHFQAGERAFGAEFSFQTVQQRHMMPHPLNLERAVGPQLKIADFAFHKAECYSELYAIEKVSPCEGSPVAMPFFSHLERWAEVPWLKESGTVRP